MDVEEMLEQLEPWRKAHRRTAWRPIVEEGDRSPQVSKFGGMPWLAKDEAYPRCGACGTQMTLFLQLDLNRLPEALLGQFGEGLLQMFYPMPRTSTDFNL